MSGYTNNIIAGANSGLEGMSVWQLSGVLLEDPCETTNTNGSYALYNALYNSVNPRKPYYQVSMLERYIPAHSSVISATTTADDIRTAAFKTSDGNYTIVVECKAGTAKNLTINFSGVNIGKTFGKHIYTKYEPKEGNALIPARRKTFSAGTNFSDSNIPSDYCTIVYTTLPAQTQVKVTPVTGNVDKGATLQLNASVIDNTGGVTWSIANGVGTISSTGLYTAPSNATYGDMVAVKAASTADPNAYGIALLTISASQPTPTPSPDPDPSPDPVGTVLLSDDFGSGLSKWSSTTNCSITGGALNITNNETIQSTSGNSSWTDFIFEADVKVTNSCAGLVFRKTDDNNFYMWQINPGSQSLRKMKKVNGSWNYIKAANCELYMNTWHRVRIEAVGSTIKTFIDGNLADTTTDTQFSSGKVGFRQWGTEAATIDNVQVSQISGPVTPLTPLLTDDFSGTLDKWSSTSYCLVSGGALNVTRNETIQNASGGSSWTNYTYEADVKVTNNYAGLVFRKIDDNNFYMCQLNTVNKKLRTMKKSGGTWNELYNVNWDLNLNTWYNVKIEVNGSSIRTFIDGNLADETIDTGFEYGKVGFREAGSSEAAVFDNVKVQEIPLLSDDFSNTLSMWQNTANCSIVSGALSIANNETIQCEMAGSDWSDYIFEADSKITSNCAGMVFRRTDDNNFYMLQMSFTTQKLRFMKKVNGTWTEIKAVTYPFALDTWYHVKIEAAGSTIKTYVNGTLADTAADTQFTKGKVGFRQCGTVEAAAFDNIRVWKK